MTGSLRLIEDTSDEFWGRGLDGNGKNMLGQLLEKLRQSVMVTPPNTQFKPSYGSRNVQRNDPKPLKHANQNTMKYSASGYSDQEPVCWYCGENNHVSHACRHQTLIYCRDCGAPGHKAKIHK